MDITKISEIEIKAFIYDELAKIETCQKNVQICNEELKKRSKSKEENPINQ